MTVPSVRRLRSLTHRLQVLRLLNDADPAISGLTEDSRSARPGALFVAVRGQKADGHDYIADAAGRGAGAVVCERLPAAPPTCPVIQVADSRRALSALADEFYGSPSQRLRVTGITGTDGKTSTTELLRTILNEAGRPAASIGTLGYCIAGRWSESDLTTPPAVALHEAFSRILEQGATDVCMEVSSHSLVLGRVAEVRFQAAVLTNVTRDHLDMHGTREEYARAKRILFEMLQPGAVAAMQAAAAADSYSKGVNKAGSARWQDRAIRKGPGRFAEGVVVGAADYGTAFAPYADTIKATTLPVRFPRGDLRNLDRVKMISQALRKKKMG